MIAYLERGGSLTRAPGVGPGGSRISSPVAKANTPSFLGSNRIKEWWVMTHLLSGPTPAGQGGSGWVRPSIEGGTGPAPQPRYGTVRVESISPLQRSLATHTLGEFSG